MAKKGRLVIEDVVLPRGSAAEPAPLQWTFKKVNSFTLPPVNLWPGLDTPLDRRRRNHPLNDFLRHGRTAQGSASPVDNQVRRAVSRNQCSADRLLYRVCSVTDTKPMTQEHRRRGNRPYGVGTVLTRQTWRRTMYWFE